MHSSSNRRGRVVAAVAVVLAIGGTVAIGVGAGSQRHPPLPPRSAAGTPPSPGATALAPSRPLRLDISAIGVHSAVQSLGLTAAGTLQAPAPGPHYGEAAWYRYSPTPGSLGPAILEGHVDSAAGGPSVFFNLGRLRPADAILVTRVDGLVAVFAVDGVRRFPKDRFPTRLIYGDLGYAGLRLITCGGPFDRSTGHYLDNVVVFASLVGSRGPGYGGS